MNLLSDLPPTTIAFKSIRGKYDVFLNKKTSKINFSNTLSKDLFAKEFKTAISKLKKVKLIKEMLPLGIAAIVVSAPGIIRNENQLNSDSLLKLIEHQTKPYKEAEINKILSKYPKEERELIKKILIKSTQFGKMESLYKIAENLEGTLYYDSLPGCSTTMRYLQKYGHFNGLFNDSQESGTVVVDKFFIERLESDVTYLEKIRNNPILRFVVPEGYITGINPFTQPESLDKFTKSIYKRFKEVQSKYPDKTNDEIISIILNEPILEKLKNLGITQEVKVINNTCEEQISDIDIILNQLNSKAITKEQIENFLSTYPPENKQYVLEILAHTLNIKSTKSCNISLKKIYSQILKANGGNLDGLYFILPSDMEVKSYSTVLMQFQEATGVKSEKIFKLKDIANLPKDARTLVILDDMACSGESLVGDAQRLAEECVKAGVEINDIIASPIVCTESAFSRINNQSFFGKYVTCIPGEIIESFCSSKYVKGFGKDEEYKFKELLEGCGYEGGDYSLAFPYMSPDNNSGLFSHYLAEFFTLFGKGVKRKGSKIKKDI